MSNALETKRPPRDPSGRGGAEVEADISNLQIPEPKQHDLQATEVSDTKWRSCIFIALYVIAITFPKGLTRAYKA